MRKKLHRRAALNVSGAVLLILAVALFFVALLFQDPVFISHYEDALRRLAEFEYAVASLPYKWQFFLAIFSIFLLKAIVPIPIPISAVCLISGMALPMPLAILVNIIGFGILATVKYFWGKHLGGGWVHKFLTRNDELKKVLNADRKSNAILLIAFRLVPSFPVSTISKLYGAMKYDYGRFLLYSVLGYLPKLLSYSVIGKNVYNPFSMAFMLPIVLLFLISGLAMFAINGIIQFINKTFKNKESKENKNQNQSLKEGRMF